MSTTQIVDATTTEQRSGSEPQRRRVVTCVVRSTRATNLAVGDIADFAEALIAASAPTGTVLRFDKGADNYMTIVAEWHYTVDEKDKS